MLASVLRSALRSIRSRRPGAAPRPVVFVCDVPEPTQVAANSKASKFTTIPDPKTWRVSDSAAYLHYTPNETVFGVEFHAIPEVSKAPLVADMSSTLLSRPLDVSRFGVIYGGAQKNIGPPGVAVVIVREDLLGKARRETPGVMDYKTMAESD